MRHSVPGFCLDTILIYDKFIFPGTRKKMKARELTCISRQRKNTIIVVALCMIEEINNNLTKISYVTINRTYHKSNCSKNLQSRSDRIHIDVYSRSNIVCLLDNISASQWSLSLSQIYKYILNFSDRVNLPHVRSSIHHVQYTVLHDRCAIHDPRYMIHVRKVRLHDPNTNIFCKGNKYKDFKRILLGKSHDSNSY